MQAPENDRLRFVRELIYSPDLDMKKDWDAFRRSDPLGAFDSLVQGSLTLENGVFRNKLFGTLAFDDEIFLSEIVFRSKR